ncbi:MAG: hypothetical protein ABSC18_07895 [Verrucomicrobiota bacterium]
MEPEAEGGAVARGSDQMKESRTDACVLNGRGFSSAGFGLLRKDLTLIRLPDKAALFAALGACLEQRGAA